MAAASWICLLLPLASALAITLAGTAITRRVAAYVSTLTTMGAFAAAVVVFVEMLSKSPSSRGSTTTSWTWLSAGQYHFGLSLLVDQLSVVMMLIISGRQLADRRLLDRLHGRRERRAALLRVHVAVRLLDAAARRGRQSADPARGLGHGRPLELPADRLLPGAAVGGRGREEGVRDERRRRCDDRARALPA